MKSVSKLSTKIFSLDGRAGLGVGSGKWEGERKKEKMMLINWLPTHPPHIQPPPSPPWQTAGGVPQTHTPRPAWGNRHFFCLSAGGPGGAELQV